MARIMKSYVAAMVLVGMLAGIAGAQGFYVPVTKRIPRPIPRPVPPAGQWALKYHHVDIRIRDQVASVSSDQKILNTGSGMLEVQYMFPVPPGAAIDSLTLVVNGKEFAAKLLPANEARAIYEDIVRRRKDPALLEYVGYGLYKTSAFPLEPNKPARIQVTYKSICRKNGDAVEVWYPLSTDKFSAKAAEEIRVTVDIKSKADVTAVYSPSHNLDVKRRGNGHVVATYQAKNTLPTTDFQVFYQVAKKDIGATLLTHQPDMRKDGYFLTLVSPSPRLRDAKVMAKDVVVVVDRSGSMSGKKIAQARESVEFILKRLNKGDRFNVITYSDGVEPMFNKLMAASAVKVKFAVDEVDRIEAGGGTNIDAALVKAMGQWPAAEDKSQDRPRYIIFLTDGLATVGKVGEKDILTDTKKANHAGVRLFAFGVGYDVNVRLLDKLAGENNGRSDYVKPNEPIEKKISSLYNKIKNPVMTNLSVEIGGVRLKDVYPRKLGDLFEGDQIVIAGRFDPRELFKKKTASPDGFHTQLLVKGMYQGKQRVFEYPVVISNRLVKRRGMEFVEKIWAMRRVGYLMDQVQLHGRNKEIIDELVALSKQYGIMTPYTSFLADETTVLHKPTMVRARAESSMKKLKEAQTGDAGQRGAITRQQLNQADKAPMGTTSAPGAKGRKSALTKMIGNTNAGDYESGKVEAVANVRQVGNQAIYRRGNLWVAANASELDAKKDAAKIKVIKQFSDEYFELSKANTTEENQVLASQQKGEELMITLRGQTYLIK
ncbi:MAG: VWA domain-containing protein [Phycisphaerae bacterium]|nr:VWA domain-containing protein [Phycisphaerae bacterium]